MADEQFRPLSQVPLAGLRLGIPQGPMIRNLDDTVAARFSAATAALRKADARLTDELLGPLDEMAAAIRRGNFPVFESYAIHRELLEKKGQEYDPIARSVFERGSKASAADYIALTRERSRLVRAMDVRFEDIDAFVLPTTKRVAPKVSEVTTLEGYLAQQAIGSNTVWASFFDLCAISLPLPREGGLPVGLMLVARHGQDHRLFRIAAAVERLFAG